MAYEIVTVACGDEDDPWGAMLMAELERLDTAGWVLCAMTTKTVAVQQTAGMGATRYEEQLVLVLHKEGAV